MHKEIKSTTNSKNAAYNSVTNVLSSRLLPEDELPDVYMGVCYQFQITGEIINPT